MKQGYKETFARLAESKNNIISEQERRKIIRTIASCIVHKGAIRAKKRTKGRGWLCGTYTSAVREIIEKKMECMFTDEQIEFIKVHLPEKTDDRTEFALQDPEHQELCDEMNSKLNELIPSLHVNHYWHDLLDD